MIMPADVDLEKDTWEVVAKKLQRGGGYDKEASEWLAKKLKGLLPEDTNPVF